MGIDVWVAGAFMCTHIRMRCRLCVAGTALAVGLSYVMYLGHILLGIIVKFYTCQTHFQNHVSTTLKFSRVLEFSPQER